MPYRTPAPKIKIKEKTIFENLISMFRNGFKKENFCPHFWERFRTSYPEPRYLPNCLPYYKSEYYCKFCGKWKTKLVNF